MSDKRFTKDHEWIKVDGDIGTVAARTVGSRIHLWVTDEWDGAPGVGYFIYDPLGTMEESTP